MEVPEVSLEENDELQPPPVVLDQLILNSDITESILTQLGFHWMLYLRLVCRSWNLEICAILQRKSLATWSFRGDQMLHYLRIYYASKTLRLPTPTLELKLSTAQNPTFLPPAIIKTLTVKCEEPITEYSALVRLLNHCASTLEELTIFEPNHTLIDSRLFTGIRFPKLKKLVVLVPTSLEEHTETCREFLENLFTLSPNLSDLTLKGGQVLNRLVERTNLSQVKELALSSETPTSLLASLGHSSHIWGLTTLQIFCTEEPAQIDKAFVDNFLSRFENSLKILILDFRVYDIKYWPRFPLLSEVYLRGFSFKVLDRFFSGPSLVGLAFNSGCGEYPPRLGVQRSVHPQVKMLHFKMCIKRQQYTNFFKWWLKECCLRFPNVSDWGLNYLDVADFCEFAREENIKVKRLHIYFPYNGYCIEDDEAIRGFSSLKLLEDLIHLEVNNRKDSTLPGMLHYEGLDKLQHLGFCYDDWSHVVGLVDRIKNINQISIRGRVSRKRAEIEQILFSLPQITFRSYSS